MEENRVLDIDLAYEMAKSEDKGRDTGLAMGLPSAILGEKIYAHGQEFNVAEALQECRPFARAVGSIASNEFIPDEHKVSAMTKMIRDSSAKPDDPTEKIPVAVLVRNDRVTASNNAVKKN